MKRMSRRESMWQVCWALALVWSSLAGSIGAARAADSVEPQMAFVRKELPHGVSLEMPRNWRVFSENLRTTLRAAAESQGVEMPPAYIALAANCYDDVGKTLVIFNVQYQTHMDLVQEDVRAATAAEVEDLDKMVQQEAANNPQLKVMEWRGTKRRTINGIEALVTEYTRKTMEGGSGDFCVRIVRVFRKERSYSVTISYRLDAERLMRPICDRVIASLRHG